MRNKIVGVFFIAVLSAAWSLEIKAQSDSMPMRTPDGQPDVSGVFTFRTITPFQRPEQFAGRETLGPEDAAAFEKAERIRQNRDLFDPEKGSGGYRPRAEGGGLSYNEFWYLLVAMAVTAQNVVDPPLIIEAMEYLAEIPYSFLDIMLVFELNHFFDRLICVFVSK